MGKLRNKWGEDRVVPGYGIVEKDAVFTVPDAAVEGFACQPGWEPEDSKTLKTYETAVRARRERVEASTPPVVDEADSGDSVASDEAS